MPEEVSVETGQAVSDVNDILAIYGQSVPDVNEIVELYSQSPDFVKLVLSICKSYVDKDEPETAVKYLDRALTAYDDREAILLLRALADCYVQMGDKQPGRMGNGRVGLAHAD
jgi:tetratricopeptide (TPR) repeat protein